MALYGFLLGGLLGGLVVRWYLREAEIDVTVVMPEEPKPQRVSGATMVHGTTEYYSHPFAAEHLKGAHWVEGGRA